MVDIKNVHLLTNEQYALARRNGLGTSDASIVLGVNPFSNREKLIKQKCSSTLSEEEKEIGLKASVRKGNELEPFIIKKFEDQFKQKTIKPVDMFRHEEFPFLKFNYDGVTVSPDLQIPTEIKVVTTFGEKHYNKKKAIYIEGKGFRPLPEDVSMRNWSIEQKAAHYGIPPYYYTQLQQEIMGLNAPFGYLATLFEKDWLLIVFYVWRDERVINAIITEGYKVWQRIDNKRGGKDIEWK